MDEAAFTRQNKSLDCFIWLSEFVNVQRFEKMLQPGSIIVFSSWPSDKLLNVSFFTQALAVLGKRRNVKYAYAGISAQADDQQPLHDYIFPAQIHRPLHQSAFDYNGHVSEIPNPGLKTLLLTLLRDQKTFAQCSVEHKVLANMVRTVLMERSFTFLDCTQINKETSELRSFQEMCKTASKQRKSIFLVKSDLPSWSEAASEVLDANSLFSRPVRVGGLEQETAITSAQDVVESSLFEDKKAA